MVSLQLIPIELISGIFNKMEREAFLQLPAVSRLSKYVVERELHRFRYASIHYLDKLRDKFLFKDGFQRLDAEYINLILRHIQDDDFDLQSWCLGYEEQEFIDIETVLANLQVLTMFYRQEDESCLFANAPFRHVFPLNLAIFSIKNQKGADLLVRLRKDKLEVENIDGYHSGILEMAWDATRNSSSYPMPVLNQ